MTDAKPHCFSCGAELEVPHGVVGRNHTCDKCTADVRCCYNCAFYDKNAYNECHESQAERVVDKNRANFCDFFSLGKGGKSSAGSSREDALKKLDDLFK